MSTDNTSEYEKIRELIAEGINTAIENYRIHGDEMIEDIIEGGADDIIADIHKQQDNISDSDFYEASELAEEHGDVYNGEDFYKGALYAKKKILNLNKKEEDHE